MTSDHVPRSHVFVDVYCIPYLGILTTQVRYMLRVRKEHLGRHLERLRYFLWHVPAAVCAWSRAYRFHLANRDKAPCRRTAASISAGEGTRHISLIDKFCLSASVDFATPRQSHPGFSRRYPLPPQHLKRRFQILTFHFKFALVQALYNCVSLSSSFPFPTKTPRTGLTGRPSKRTYNPSTKPPKPTEPTEPTLPATAILHLEPHSINLLQVNNNACCAMTIVAASIPRVVVCTSPAAFRGQAGW
ncbi:hypothetical protein B0T17DRAFT_103185 [Bombardia bombarda]|uniref:Uncharacterized protein n=1 Tax=Bombardia bombarda TaxID=252184 RepID=A0AA39XNC9_9PEZI|nr:hypothetical protein B0T17DRAFT_103185 [Bombardia bombarda]